MKTKEKKLVCEWGHKSGIKCRGEIKKRDIQFEDGSYHKVILCDSCYNSFMSFSGDERKANEKMLLKTKKAKIFFDKRMQAEEFCEMQPIYYDVSGLWWLWDFENCKWILVDEVDVLNHVFKNMDIDTIKAKERMEILNALKQVGRLRKPKDPEKSWMQFRDKIVDIESGEEFDASPEYLITNPIPWSLGESEETPEMDKLFTEWVVDNDTQDETFVTTLKEIIAYCCCSEQFLQTMIALTGAGSNGKGTFLKLITKFIGKQNCCSSELKTLAIRNFETSALYKKLLCQMGEVDVYDLKNTNLIKQLTGEDLIRYEYKGKTPFSDYSPTTCIIATNALPVTPDKSIGFYRRWLIVDFPHQFQVQKDILTRIPDSEYPNLARKIVNVLKQLYEKGEFANNGTIEQRTQRYEERSNPIQKFIEASCEDDTGNKIKLREFALKLNKFLKNKHLRPMSVRQVGTALREEGYEVGSRKLKDFATGEEISAKVVLNLKFTTTKTIEEEIKEEKIEEK